MDFNKRWKKPGDEKHTDVPSMIYPEDPNRDYFYNYSQVLVNKGDNIRFQDISFSYALDKHKISRLPFSRAQLYIYINNLGIIWRANKYGIDPDYPDGGIPAPRTFAVGLKGDF